MELRWVFLPALVALAAAHYVFAAIALRAVAGRRLPMRDTVMTQLTAAAANRVTPSGLGGSAVNVRFLTCHGLPLRTAVTAVAAMHVLGGLADVPLVAAASPWGGAKVLARLSRAATDPRALAAVAAVVAVAALLWLRRGRRKTAARRRADSQADSHADSRADSRADGEAAPEGGGHQAGEDGRRRGWADARAGVVHLLRRPRDLLVLMVASAATTLSMAVAFALSVLAVPDAAGADRLGALVIAYLIGGCLSGLVPIPAGAGSTEAVLVAALGTLDVATGPAVQSVLLFRIITHWAPAPLGVLTARWALVRPRRPQPDSASREDVAVTVH